MDSIKGLLILIVILGHCLEVTSNSGITRIMYNGIYSFHMSLFVFISGYFTNLNKDNKSHFNSIFNLLLIYAIFQLIKSIPGLATHSLSLKSAIIFPQWTMWYILSLVFWRLLFYVLCNWCSFKINLVFLILFFIVSITCGFLPVGSELSLQRTLFYSFSFALGLYFREKKLIHLVYNANKYIVLILLSISISAIIIFNDRDINWLLYGSSNYSDWPIMYEYCSIVRIAQIILSILICIVFIKCCPINQLLSTLGTKTLFIYIYHSFVINALKHINFSCNDFIILLISLLVTFASLYILDKIPFFYHLINPIRILKNIQKACQNEADNGK